MTSPHRGHLMHAAFAVAVAGAGGPLGCAGGLAGMNPHPPSQAPVSVAAAHTPSAMHPTPARSAHCRVGPPIVAPPAPSDPYASTDAADAAQREAELVVSRDVVGQCPPMRGVRDSAADLDPDVAWRAVLESLADCMGTGGPMAQESIGVSGDEQHRHVVRDVLEARGIAPTRVAATPSTVAMRGTSPGAAECQGGGDCSQRIEITIAPGP